MRTEKRKPVVQETKQKQREVREVSPVEERGIGIGVQRCVTVSYTHLTLPTNREV